MYSGVPTREGACVVLSLRAGRPSPTSPAFAAPWWSRYTENPKKKRKKENHRTYSPAPGRGAQRGSGARTGWPRRPAQRTATRTVPARLASPRTWHWYVCESAGVAECRPSSVAMLRPARPHATFDQTILVGVLVHIPLPYLPIQCETVERRDGWRHGPSIPGQCWTKCGQNLAKMGLHRIRVPGTGLLRTSWRSRRGAPNGN